MTPLETGQLLTEEQYLEAFEQYGDEFTAMMGAEAIQKMLARINLKEESEKIREEIATTSSETREKKLTKRSKLIESFLSSGNKPEWMIMICQNERKNSYIAYTYTTITISMLMVLQLYRPIRY